VSCRSGTNGRGPSIRRVGLIGAALEPMIQRVREHFGQSGKARYIDHADAAAIPPLQVAINAFSGVPSVGELGLLSWRPGGGNLRFLPGTPMDGRIANEIQRICRAIYVEHGMDYMVMNVCGPRFARGLHVITFNREDEDERARADACYRKMSEEVSRRGVYVGRAPVQYHALHMAQAMPGVSRRLQQPEIGARSEPHHCPGAVRDRIAHVAVVAAFGGPCVAPRSRVALRPTGARAAPEVAVPPICPYISIVIATSRCRAEWVIAPEET
jgi:hypothetical protein